MPPVSEVVNSEGKPMSEADVRNCLDELRTLVQNDEQFKDLRTDDGYLLRFLHACQFNVHWAYKRMKAYWNLVLEHPNWFQTGGPLEHKEHLNLYCKQMAGRDREGRFLYINKLSNVNPSKLGVYDAAHLDDIWLEAIIDDPIVLQKGVTILVDVANTPWRLMKWATPYHVSIGLKKLELYPVKDIMVHVVNTTFVMNAAIKILWPFLNPKMKERIKFHFEDMKALHEYISPDQLPPEYGGTAKIDYDSIVEKLLDKNDEICRSFHFYEVAIKSK